MSNSLVYENPNVQGYVGSSSATSSSPAKDAFAQENVGCNPAAAPTPEQARSHVIWSTETTARRRFFFSIGGSLFDLANGQCRWMLTNEHAAQYRPHGSKRCSERKGDVDKALIQAVYIRWMDNGFDKPVMLCSDELRGNCYSNERGIRGLQPCPARKALKFGKKGYRVYYADSTFNNPIMRQHGDLKESDLACPLNESPRGDGTYYKYYSVHRNHPMGWVLINNSNIVRGAAAKYTVGRNAPNQRPNDVPVDEDGNLRVPPDFFAAAYEAYKTNVLNVIRFNKMRGLDLYLASPDGNAASDCYLEDLCGDPAELDAVKGSCRYVTGEIEVVYRLAGHGLVGAGGKN